MIAEYRFAFKIGDTVYLKTDPAQLERLITGINIRQNGLSYEVSLSEDLSWHYDFELSREQNIAKKLE
ncbi:MAG: hypothetical protein DRJ15_15550 [Bacteroidetes bacterium]|nr:MAG: hypothetical protein DRJ15_15550 [Bacteroidota bacterium]